MKFIYLLIIYVVLFSYTVCYSQKKDSIYHAGLNSNELFLKAMPKHRITQKSSNLCWAACVQLVLQYQGIKINQKKIVNQVLGVYQNLTVRTSFLVEKINNWHITISKKTFLIAATSKKLNKKNIIQHLLKNNLIILGMGDKTNGHMYVLYGVDYKIIDNNNFVIEKIYTYNPLPRDKFLNSFSWSEITNKDPDYLIIDIK